MSQDAAARENATREGFVDAAERCFSQFGLGRTTMSDVATAAGVHRATLYRYFADRDELVLAVLLRESRPIIARAARRMEKAANVEEGLVRALVGAIEDLQASEQLPLLFATDFAASTVRSAAMSEEFVELARAAVFPALRRAQEAEQLRPAVDIDDAIAWLLRVALSFLIESPQQSAREQTRLLHTFVMPAIFAQASA